MSAVAELIQRLEDELGTITQRLFVLESFAKELERVTRSKPFRIWGSAVWMMILDSRDTHVTHLASWLKAAYSKGGVFGQLTADHLRQFPRKWRPRNDAKHSRHFAAVLKSQHDDIFARTFPGATGAFPRPEDFDGVKQRFVDAVQHVVADRDGNRAHPYEKAGSASSSAKHLDLGDLRGLTTNVEHLLNDLRQLSIGSTFVHSDMNFQSPADLAQDLVDAVLVGSRWRVQLMMADAERDAYYDDLHARHAARGNPDEPLFNDVATDEVDE